VSRGLRHVADARHALEGLTEPSLTEGVQAARRGSSRRTTWRPPLQDVDAPEMKLHAEWLPARLWRRSRAPGVRAVAPSPADDTPPLIERLLAEKDQAGYVLFRPGRS